MGVSYLSALIIATTQVVPLGNGPDDKGKWQGIIGHAKDHPAHPYMPIISSDFRYDSEQAAIDGMQAVIDEIREKEGNGK